MTDPHQRRSFTTWASPVREWPRFRNFASRIRLPRPMSRLATSVAASKIAICIHLFIKISLKICLWQGYLEVYQRPDSEENNDRAAARALAVGGATPSSV